MRERELNKSAESLQIEAHNASTRQLNHSHVPLLLPRVTKRKPGIRVRMAAVRPPTT